MATNWYNLNRFTDYPLVHSRHTGTIGAMRLGKGLLLDAGFQIAAPVDAQADIAVHISKVVIATQVSPSYLSTISVHVTVGNTADAFVFTATSTVEPTSPPRAIADTLVFAESEYGVAYIVLGDWRSIHAGEYVQTVPDYTRFEPATVQVVANYGVVKLELYSQTAMADTEDDLIPIWVGEVSDRVNLVPGYNLQPVISFNGVILRAALGAGLGQVRLTQSVDESDDKFTCCNSVCTLNGIAPDERGNFIINTFNTMTVVPSGNGLKFELDPNQLLINCPPHSEASSSSDIDTESSSSPLELPSQVTVGASIRFDDSGCGGCVSTARTIQLDLPMVSDSLGHIYYEGITDQQVVCDNSVLRLRFRVAPMIPGHYSGSWGMWVSRNSPAVITQNDGTTTYIFNQFALLGTGSMAGTPVGSYGGAVLAGLAYSPCQNIIYSGVTVS